MRILSSETIIDSAFIHLPNIICLDISLYAEKFTFLISISLSDIMSFIENDFKTNNAKTETQIAETIKNLNNNIYISCFSSDRDLLD